MAKAQVKTKNAKVKLYRGVAFAFKEEELDRADHQKTRDPSLAYFNTYGNEETEHKKKLYLGLRRTPLNLVSNLINGAISHITGTTYQGIYTSYSYDPDTAVSFVHQNIKGDKRILAERDLSQPPSEFSNFDNAVLPLVLRKDVSKVVKTYKQLRAVTDKHPTLDSLLTYADKIGGLPIDLYAISRDVQKNKKYVEELKKGKGRDDENSDSAHSRAIRLTRLDDIGYTSEKEVTVVGRKHLPAYGILYDPQEHKVDDLKATPYEQIRKNVRLPNIPSLHHPLELPVKKTLRDKITERRARLKKQRNNHLIALKAAATKKAKGMIGKHAKYVKSTQSPAATKLGGKK